MTAWIDLAFSSLRMCALSLHLLNDTLCVTLVCLEHRVIIVWHIVHVHIHIKLIAERTSEYEEGPNQLSEIMARISIGSEQVSEWEKTSEKERKQRLSYALNSNKSFFSSTNCLLLCIKYFFLFISSCWFFFVWYGDRVHTSMTRMKCHGILWGDFKFYEHLIAHSSYTFDVLIEMIVSQLLMHILTLRCADKFE